MVATPAAAGGAPPHPSAFPPAASAGLTDNVASALCYLLGCITGIFFLLLAPYNQNRTIRFHAFQSIYLNVAALVLSFALGAFFGAFMGPLIWLAFTGLSVYLVVQAYQGKMIVLPVIGPLAQKQS
jgi:uncharacterized membrane protein